MGRDIERNLFLTVHQNDPFKPGQLFELWWEPVEKHNTSEIASFRALKRAVEFSHGPGIRGTGLTLERIEREWRWYDSSGPFTVRTATTPSSLEEVAAVLDKMRKYGRWEWAWKQFWHFNPHALRDETGLIWWCHGTPNSLRLLRNSRAHRLERALTRLVELPNPLLRVLKVAVTVRYPGAVPGSVFTVYAASDKVVFRPFLTCGRVEIVRFKTEPLQK